MNNVEAYEQLLLTLENRITPSFYFICCNNDITENDIKSKLINNLSRYKHYSLDVSSITVESLSKTLNDVLPSEILSSKPLEYAVHIDGLELSLFATEDGRFIHTQLPEELNFERELLFNGYPFVTIIWSSKYFYKELFQKAPDLSNWLINYFEFTTEKQTDTPINELPIKEELQFKGATPERIERIHELENLVGRLNRENPDQRKILLEKLDAFTLLGKEYKEAFQWKEAEDAYVKALQLAEITDKKYKAAQINFLLGQVFLETRKFTAALNCYYGSLNLLITLKDATNIGNVYHGLGRVYERQYNLEEALTNYKSSIEWNEKANNQSEIGGTYHHIGRIYEKQEQWSEALLNYNRAIEWFEKTNFKFELGGTYHQIGNLYFKQNNLTEALVNYQRAVKELELHGNYFHLGNAYLGIAEVYRMNYSWELALSNYDKALFWNEKTGNYDGLGHTYHQIGVLFEELGKINEAKDSFQKSIDYLSSINHLFTETARHSLERINGSLVSG